MRRGTTRSGHAVAAVHDHLQRLRHRNVVQHAIEIVIDDFHFVVLALAVAELVAFDAFAQALDALFGQRLASDHHLEPVVLGRIVRPGDHHAGAGVERVRRVVQQRRRHLADVGDVDAAFGHAARQRLLQLRTRQATVAADDCARHLLLLRFGRERASDPVDDVFGEVRCDDAANVVCAKDQRVELQARVERRDFF